MKNAVVILEGETGSGKSTQVPQIVLQLFWADMSLLARKVVHVCPLIEPLRGLHQRLEDEMDAHGQIRLATGRVSERGQSAWLVLMTARVLVQMWWELVKRPTIMIFDEAHIRSTAYSELFQMVLPMVSEKRVKLVVMSATLNNDTLADLFADVRHCMFCADFSHQGFPWHS